MALMDRLAHAWNAFSTGSEFEEYRRIGASHGSRPDRARIVHHNDKSIIGSIINRISIDASSIQIRHVKNNKDGLFEKYISSGLDNCLTLEANIDQNARAFLQDLVITLLDKGVVAIVPIDTDINPDITDGFDIRTMRVGEIVQWYPEHVRVSVFNQDRGMRQEILLRKKYTAIVENPFYTVMNEANATLKRVISRLRSLDSVGDVIGAGKLDLIFQLPYSLKTDKQRDEAARRREDLEDQLKRGSHGVAYIDSTEKVTQLNRPVENNILKEIEYLTNLMYGELGITREIMEGTANEDIMTNYYNRTLEPILANITLSMKRTFLTKTGRTQGQSIEFFNDPFKLLSISKVAELGDKLTRNEIVTGNEFRKNLGMTPIDDPRANVLKNKNLPDKLTESGEEQLQNES